MSTPCQVHHQLILANLNRTNDNPFQQKPSCQCPDAFTLFLNLLREETTPVNKILPLIVSFGYHRDQQKPKIQLFTTQKCDIFTTLLKRNADLKTLDYANWQLLNVDKDTDFRTQTLNCIYDAARNGRLQRPMIEWAFKNHLMTPEILQYAFLIGFDDHKTVKRPENWIDFSAAEPAIQMAIGWKNDQKQWQQAVQAVQLADKPYVVSYDRFCRIIEPYPVVDLSPEAQIQKFIKKHREQRLNFVQLFEILYHRIAQTPDLKDTVIRMLQENGLPMEFIEDIHRINFRNARPNVIPELSNVQLKNTAKLFNFLQRPPKVPIILLTSMAQIKELEKKVKSVSHSDYPYVGFDLEFNRHATNPENQVKYLQFAFRDAIYMFKVTGTNSRDLDQVCEAVFPKKRLTKIGFIIPAQMDNLRTSLPQPDNSKVLSRRMAMRDLHMEIRKTKGNKKEKDRISLWSLCNRYLKKPLDNSERWSVWSREPLRQEQEEYAALDAYCLLMLRDKIDNDGRSCGYTG